MKKVEFASVAFAAAPYGALAGRGATPAAARIVVVRSTVDANAAVAPGGSTPGQRASSGTRHAASRNACLSLSTPWSYSIEPWSLVKSTSVRAASARASRKSSARPTCAWDERVSGRWNIALGWSGWHIVDLRVDVAAQAGG